jgi:hypothetical protein
LKAVTSNDVPHTSPPKDVKFHKAKDFRRAAE